MVIMMMEKLASAMHYTEAYVVQAKGGRLTVKETMLETSVVKADGMKVSCLGMGLMRNCTFCSIDKVKSGSAMCC